MRLAARPAGLQVVLIEGEPGIGKTTLWQAGVERARSVGYRVFSCRAAQAETRCRIGGLADLLANVESGAFDTPSTGHRYGRSFEPTPGPGRRRPLALGTGILGILSRLAERDPILVAIDDLHWLDNRRSTRSPLRFGGSRTCASRSS